MKMTREREAKFLFIDAF